MAGVKSNTSLSDVLDLLTVIMLEVPEQHLRKWRQGMDRAAVVAQAKAGTLDRKTWGLAPHQVEQQRRALEQLGQGG